MSVTELPKYSVVECEITAHQDYGLLVHMAQNGSGFVDRVEIFDNPADHSSWPAVGSRCQAVVLGSTRDGRSRLSMRPRDLMLVESLSNPAEGLNIWREVRDSGVPGESFYEIPEVLVLLRWALMHPRNSLERSRAKVLVSTAPVRIQADLIGLYEDEHEE